MKDLNNIINNLKDARMLAMRIAVAANLNNNLVKETNANILYDKLEEAFIYAVKLQRLADES